MSKNNMSENLLNCKKCNIGKVEVKATLKEDGVDVVIKKCNNCNYQYGLKDILADNGIDLKFTDKQNTQWQTK